MPLEAKRCPHGAPWAACLVLEGSWFFQAEAPSSALSSSQMVIEAHLLSVSIPSVPGHLSLTIGALVSQSFPLTGPKEALLMLLSSVCGFRRGSGLSVAQCQVCLLSRKSLSCGPGLL